MFSFTVDKVRVLKFSHLKGTGKSSGKPYDFTESLIQSGNLILKLKDFSGNGIDLKPHIGSDVKIRFEILSGDKEFEPQLRVVEILK